MTAHQHEESVLDATVLAELADISSKFYPGSPDVKAALNDYRHQVEQICNYINLEQFAYLLDYIMILIEGLDQLTEVDRELSAPECSFLQKVPIILSEYLILQNIKQADEHLLELLKDPLWIRPITADEETQLAALSNEDLNHSQNSDSVELVDLLSSINIDEPSYNAITDKPVLDIVENFYQEVDTDVKKAIPDINTHQQELVDLISAELEEIIDNQHDITEGNHDQCKIILKNMADQAENISNAVNLIGLEGLSRSCKFISNNMNSFVQSAGGFNKNQVFILKQWPIKILGCLQNINDTDAIAELLALLCNETWNETLTSTERTSLKELLENPVFLEEEQEQRQVKATDDDVELTLPDDVNQELLDGLLQDLPVQTEEFSTAIQNIAEGGDIVNLDVAQRIAHTLKGAANVVGVKGIANLTHHLEDILQAQAKANALPEISLINVLVRASDCLESMTEALLGIDTQPDDAVSVLQDVLDWANKLDTGMVSHSEMVNNGPDTDLPYNPPAETSDNIAQEPASKTDSKQVQKNVTTENVLRIPVSLADDMLRLTGENLIYTSQIHEQINIITKRQDALDLHNQSLFQLSYDLERYTGLYAWI